MLTKRALLYLNVALDEGNDPSVGSGIVEVDQFLDQGLVEEEPVVHRSPTSGVKLGRWFLTCTYKFIK